MSEHENDLAEIKRLKAELTRLHRVDALVFCNQARGAICSHLIPHVESCNLSEDEHGTCFVFKFTLFAPRVEFNRETLSVSREIIEDGIMSQQELRAMLWHTLGKLRGMA
jgi:hypothetical protein